MPCNSDYMEQTPQEAANRVGARMLINALELMDRPVRREILDGDTYYSKADWAIPELCGLLSDLSPEELEDLLYSDARDSRRRDLAGWWEKHQEADALRTPLTTPEGE